MLRHLRDAKSERFVFVDLCTCIESYGADDTRTINDIGYNEQNENCFIIIDDFNLKHPCG